MPRYVLYVAAAVLVINLTMWILIETPIVAIVDEWVPIGKRGLVPGGRRPAAIGRWMAPFQQASYSILMVTWPHPLVGILSLTAETGLICGYFALVEKARSSKSGRRRRASSGDLQEDDPNPFDSPRS